MSHVIKEVASVLGIALKHAKTKHAKASKLLEQSHASFTQTLKAETGERRSLWHKHVSIAILNCNTPYHTSIIFVPCRFSRGGIPYNIVDLKLEIRQQQAPIRTSEIARNALDQKQMIHQDVGQNPMQA